MHCLTNASPRRHYEISSNLVIISNNAVLGLDQLNVRFSLWYDDKNTWALDYLSFDVGSWRFGFKNRVGLNEIGMASCFHL